MNLMLVSISWNKQGACLFASTVFTKLLYLFLFFPWSSSVWIHSSFTRRKAIYPQSFSILMICSSWGQSNPVGALRLRVIFQDVKAQPGVKPCSLGISELCLKHLQMWFIRPWTLAPCWGDLQRDLAGESAPKKSKLVKSDCLSSVAFSSTWANACKRRSCAFTCCCFGVWGARRAPGPARSSARWAGARARPAPGRWRWRWCPQAVRSTVEAEQTLPELRKRGETLMRTTDDQNWKR